MESFKQQFLDRARGLLAEWSFNYGVDPPPVYVLDDREIDPFFATAMYVRPGITASNIKGPAIMFAEAYIRDVYEAAVRTGNFEAAWNSLTWSLAHEFGHHVAHRRRIVELELLELTAPLSEYVRRGEISASLVAYRLTGKTRAQRNYEFWKLTGLTIMQYWRNRVNEWNAVHRLPIPGWPQVLQTPAEVW